MRRAAPAALFLLILACACGKVGDPKPPIVRTPEPIGDLRAVQSGDNVILTWTNPARYVDSNPATDLAVVRILRNGVEVAKETVKAAGQPQSYTLNIKDSLGADVRFDVRVETQRGRVSMSNGTTIRPVEVPGAPRNLEAVVDQLKITLTWQAPEANGNLAEAYIVQRADRPAPQVVQMNRFEDREYEQGKTYTYAVTASRRPDGSIPGSAGVSVMVTANDTIRPAKPEGLEIELAGNGVFLKWTPNTEEDLKEYLVYRSDRVEPFTTPVDGFPDVDYKPGLSYQLEAVDLSGNKSERTAPKSGP